jgi:hypothetical protein
MKPESTSAAVRIRALTCSASESPYMGKKTTGQAGQPDRQPTAPSKAQGNLNTVKAHLGEDHRDQPE